jgi:16S rRNA G966 N2-methylase RsmD
VHLHARAFEQTLPQLNGLDLIFADPPFPWFTEQPATLTTLLQLAGQSLAGNGRLIIRGERGHELPTLPNFLREKERRFYGRSWVVSLQRLQQPPAPTSLAK